MAARGRRLLCGFGGARRRDCLGSGEAGAGAAPAGRQLTITGTRTSPGPLAGILRRTCAPFCDCEFFPREKDSQSQNARSRQAL